MPEPQLFYKTVTIAAAGAQTPEIDLMNLSLCGIWLPATFTGSSVTFQVAPGVNDGNGKYTSGTYGNFASDGVNADVFIVTQGLYVPISTFVGARFLKITSASTEGAARDLILALKPL